MIERLEENMMFDEESILGRGLLDELDNFSLSSYARAEPLGLVFFRYLIFLGEIVRN